MLKRIINVQKHINDIIIAQCQIRALIKMISNTACRELSIIKSIFNGIDIMIAQCQVILQSEDKIVISVLFQCEKYL